MKNVMSVIIDKAPSLVKSTRHLFENDKYRALAEITSPHKDVQIINIVQFAKKERFKDYGPALKAAKEAGISVKRCAATIGCSLSTAYKAIRDCKK